MAYSKSDKTKFSDAEITMMLMKNHKNGKDGLWIKTKTDCWDSKDGKLIATQITDIQTGRPVLSINNKSWYDKQAKKLKALDDL
jgi:hypothetical protein